MFSFYNSVLCEQDLEKMNSKDKTIQLTKGQQKPSTERGGPSSNVDKAKGRKKKSKASKSGKGKPSQEGRARISEIILGDSESKDTAIDVSKVNLESSLLYTAYT
jgi:hypothetical protein